MEKTRECLSIVLEEAIFTDSLIFVALVYLAGCVPDDIEERRRRLDNVDAIIVLAKIWAENCESDFGHKHLLLKAEKVRVADDDVKAMRPYNQSIRSAIETDLSISKPLPMNWP